MNQKSQNSDLLGEMKIELEMKMKINRKENPEEEEEEEGEKDEDEDDEKEVEKLVIGRSFIRILKQVKENFHARCHNHLKV